LEELIKITEIHTQDSRYPSWDSNRLPAEYKLKDLSLEPINIPESKETSDFYELRNIFVSRHNH
jgi:hypothetical protein